MLKAVRELQSRQLTHRLLFTFASQLDHARLRALWASKFITIIRGDKDPDNASIFTASLQDQLRSCSLDNSHYQGFDQSESQSIEKEMKAMFKTGVLLNQTVYTQDRFLDARLNEEAKDENNRLFVFIPTILVTRPVFAFIQAQKDQQCMLYGNYGIGKSTAFMLYGILTNYINKYWHLTLHQNKAKQLNVLSELLKNGQILKVSKVFYASISIGDLDDEKLTKIILGQIDEFDQKKKEMYKKCTLLKLISVIRQKYDFRSRFKELGFPFTLGKTHTLMIVDRINELARGYKTYSDQMGSINLQRYLLQKEKKQLTQPQYQQKLQIISKLSLQANRKMRKCRQARNAIYYFACGVRSQSKTIFNSTFKISSFLLMKKSICDEGMNLEDSHERMIKERIRYCHYHNLPWGQLAFKQYIWEEIVMRLVDFSTNALKSIEVSPKQESECKAEEKQLSYCKAWYEKEMSSFLIPVTWRLLSVRYAFKTIQKQRKAEQTERSFLNLLNILKSEIGKFSDQAVLTLVDAQGQNLDEQQG